MVLSGTPYIIKKLCRGLVWDIKDIPSTIYLTFDDGPTPLVTPAILDILEQYHARATFFCIGRNAERHPELIQLLLDKGHSIGNHTYSHLKGWYASNREYFSDIELASRYVKSALFRPAYGMIRPGQSLYLKKQFKIVMWDVMSYDFHPRVTREQCLSHVIKHTSDGSVIVFHDSLKASEKMLYALPLILQHFCERGYSFAAIPDPKTAISAIRNRDH